MKEYRYVGPPEIAARVRPEQRGTAVRTAEEVRPRLERGGAVTLTYVVDSQGLLRVADRRSEHVACAAGEPVRSAGEIAFVADRRGRIEIAWVSNQSAGYCPEPESWPAVAAALLAAGFAPPTGFEPACIFRRCGSCTTINLIKNGAYECAVCGRPLSETYDGWNIERV